MPMFPPEVIAAAKERERAREQELADQLARRIVTALRSHDDVGYSAVLSVPAMVVLQAAGDVDLSPDAVLEAADALHAAMVSVEMVDGTELVITVTPSH